MERNVEPTKRRSYDSPTRRLQAERTREAILTAALDRFLADGFVATTVAAIASAAGVSADTVYKAFGGKPGIVRALALRALHGEGAEPAEHRSERLHDHDADARDVISGWAALTREVAPRIAPILLLVRDAAAHDAAMAGLRDELSAARLERMQANARRLAGDGGRLRAGLDIAEAGEILWTFTAPELYELLVHGRGWSVEHYAGFVERAITATLLP